MVSTYSTSLPLTSSAGAGSTTSPAETTWWPSISRSATNGSPEGQALPAAWRRRPKFGSPPWSAALTSGELAIERATGSTASGRPFTTIRPTRLAPSPSATMSMASWRRRASSASPSLSSSGLSGSTRTPVAPFANANTVSLVESWPSTEMRSKERFTQTPVSRSRVSCRRAASVCTKQNIVAKRGWIIPAPFACAARRTRPPVSSTSRQARLGPLSLVRIDSEKAPASPSSAAQAWWMPASTLSRGSSCPITPVEATPTWAGATPRCSAALDCIAAAVSRPRRPSPTFEQPELAATARRPPRSACFETMTGAPTRALVVKRAADTVSASSDTSTPTSRPSGLIPAATPAARNPAGRACGSSSRTCPGASTQRERKKVTRARAPRSLEPLGLRQAQHEVEVLHGLAGGALPEVVDRAEREDAVAGHGDVNGRPVREAHVAGVGRRVEELHEGLVRVEGGVQAADGVAVERVGELRVAARHQALVDRQQVRDEREVDAGKLLLELGEMAVALGLVGVDVVGGGDEVGLLGGLAPGPRDAGLDVDDGLLEPPLERQEGEDGGGRVAPGTRHELRFSDLLAGGPRGPLSPFPGQPPGPL